MKSSSSVAFGGTFGQAGVDSTWFNIEISFKIVLCYKSLQIKKSRMKLTELPVQSFKIFPTQLGQRRAIQL